MVSALKLVFVAVAVICYMQTVEMAPTNLGFLDNLADPDFWDEVGNNLDNVASEFGKKVEEYGDNLHNAASEFEKNVEEFAITLQTMAEQRLQNAEQANKA